MTHTHLTLKHDLEKYGVLQGQPYLSDTYGCILTVRKHFKLLDLEMRSLRRHVAMPFVLREEVYL